MISNILLATEESAEPGRQNLSGIAILENVLFDTTYQNCMFHSAQILYPCTGNQSAT